MLAEQAGRFGVQTVALASKPERDQLRSKLPDEVQILAGADAMTELIALTKPDMLLSGVVGSAGLAPTLEAIKCGATPAIANKETLVMAGELVMDAAANAGLEVIPVDSEHSAIHQCLRSGRREEVSRVVITASGGALRDWPGSRLPSATVGDTLNHPTWDMGTKITIDSATLINKALEVVEAHWLFGLSSEQIGVVLHPQSVIHSYVEFYDGSVIAQMGQPDMTLPIAYALSHPDRMRRQVPHLDLPATGKLTFRACEGRFARAVNLGYEAIDRGGLSGAVLNGANEAAVEAFMAGEISFSRIVPIVEETLAETPETGQVTLEALLEADGWARRHVNNIAGVKQAQPQTG